MTPDTHIELCDCGHLKTQHEKHFGCTVNNGLYHGNCPCMDYKQDLIKNHERIQTGNL